MELMMTSVILLIATNCFYYRKYRQEQKKCRQIRVDKKRQVEARDKELDTVEQKLDLCKDLVFEHVSTLEEKEMPAFDLAGPLIAWVGTRSEFEIASAETLKYPVDNPLTGKTA